MISKLLLAAAVLCTLAGLVQAQPSAHYVPGVEGIKAASLPPPGVYVRDYNVGYMSSRFNDGGGHDVGPPGFEAYVYANVPRVLYITDVKVLGGFLGVDALLPLQYTQVKAGESEGTFGIGDLFAEATISWHPKQFDFAVGAGLWMPTGDAPPPMTRAGLGYWTPMLTAGATWYIDQPKTWSVSALTRYEFNTEKENTDITPGQAFTLEWGIAKTINKTIDIGVVGYYQQQVTTDSGSGSNSARDRVAGIGPEISIACPKCMVFASFRYLYEFMAEDRMQGHTFCLTLTKKL
jgi:hypothetical protein